MNDNVVQQWDFAGWSPRAKLYSIAVLIAVSYLMLGRLMNDNLTWVQIHLPISVASVLLLGLSAAEAYLYVLRVQQRSTELAAAGARERELSQQGAVQRQTALNAISRALIDKLDVNQFPPEVLEDTARLFAADLVVLWVADKMSSGFSLKGSFGLGERTARQLDTLGKTTPCFESMRAEPRQWIVEDFRKDTAPSLAWFCEQEKLVLAVFNPIVRRKDLVGVLGLFYRAPMECSPSLAVEMQTVANLVSAAIQAEELYRDLVQVQKIESIGTLTSGIAHDFNNVLAAILACASYVKQQTDAKSPSYRYLEATEASALRGAALTKQLLSFVRREQPRWSVIDVNEAIEQTLKILERSFDKSILFQRLYARDLRPIEADSSYLEQVVLNIAVNARDAMPNGGIFTAATRNQRLSVDDTNRPAVDLPDGEYIVLGFRDTGCGMDAATRQRLFEPFFTTKRAGKGTGLGLSVVHNIVTNLGGDLRVDSEPGRGTLFEVFLPVTTKPLPTAAARAQATVRGGDECILLAEDEEVIREMAKLALEAKGYRVLTAADGAAAMAVYREHWEQIQLVIADMVMPQMSGAELFAHMKKINPEVRVIVSSGYSHDQEGQRMLQHGCLGYLQKPYSSDALNELVRAVLDSGL